MGSPDDDMYCIVQVAQKADKRYENCDHCKDWKASI